MKMAQSSKQEILCWIVVLMSSQSVFPFYYFLLWPVNDWKSKQRLIRGNCSTLILIIKQFYWGLKGFLDVGQTTRKS